MANEPHLPEYNVQDDQAAPPSYSPPSAYNIGPHALVNPLVGVEQLKAHLGLLKALYDLRQVVEAGDDQFPELVQAMGPEQKWGWFISLAVERQVTVRFKRVRSLWLN